MQNVKLPDGTTLQFPDGMSQDEMRSAINNYLGGASQPAARPERSFGDMLYENVIGRGDVDTPGEKLGQYIRGAGAAVARGLADVPAIPVNIAQLGALGVEKLAGMEQPSAVSRGLAKLPDTREMLASVPVIGPESEYVAPGRAGRFIATGGEFVGSGAGLGGARAIPQALGAGVASEGAGQLFEGSSLEPYARVAGGVAGALAVGGVEAAIQAIRRGALRSEFARNTETVEQLNRAASKLYDDARANGVTANATQTTAMRDAADSLLRKEGAITPTGRINPSYSGLNHAMRTLDDYAGDTMTPTEMLTVRRVLQDAAKSADPAEARLAGMLRRQFDAAIDPLAPQIKQANAIYSRMAQGELIEQTIELAGSRAGQFSGSGFENALRTEFRSLENKIIKGKLRASPDETALITRIARGGTIENVLRDIGKASPTGIISTGISTGVPFAIGNAIGGPAVGLAAAAGVPAAGFLGRKAATALQSGNADFLSAVARAGGQAPVGLMQQPGSLLSPRILPALSGLLAQ